MPSPLERIQGAGALAGSTASVAGEIPAYLRPPPGTSSVPFYAPVLKGLSGTFPGLALKAMGGPSYEYPEGHEPGMLERIVEGATSFSDVIPALFTGGATLAGRAALGPVLKTAVKSAGAPHLAGKALAARAAGRFSAPAVAQAAQTGAYLTGYEAAKEPLRQYAKEGEIRPLDVATAALRSGAAGAVAGGLAGKVASRFPTSRVAQFAAEVAGFGTAAPLLHGEAPTPGGYAETAGMLGALKVPGMIGERRAARDADLRRMEAAERERALAEEVEQLRRLGLEARARQAEAEGAQRAEAARQEFAKNVERIREESLRDRLNQIIEKARRTPAERMQAEQTAIETEAQRVASERARQAELQAIRTGIESRYPTTPEEVARIESQAQKENLALEHRRRIEVAQAAMRGRALEQERLERQREQEMARRHQAQEQARVQEAQDKVLDLIEQRDRLSAQGASLSAIDLINQHIAVELSVLPPKMRRAIEVGLAQRPPVEPTIPATRAVPTAGPMMTEPRQLRAEARPGEPAMGVTRRPPEPPPPPEAPPPVPKPPVPPAPKGPLAAVPTDELIRRWNATGNPNVAAPIAQELLSRGVDPLQHMPPPLQIGGAVATEPFRPAPPAPVATRPTIPTKPAEPTPPPPVGRPPEPSPTVPPEPARQVAEAMEGVRQAVKGRRKAGKAPVEAAKEPVQPEVPPKPEARIEPPKAVPEGAPSGEKVAPTKAKPKPPYEMSFESPSGERETRRWESVKYDKLPDEMKKYVDDQVESTWKYGLRGKDAWLSVKQNKKPITLETKIEGGKTSYSVTTDPADAEFARWAKRGDLHDKSFNEAGRVLAEQERVKEEKEAAERARVEGEERRLGEYVWELEKQHRQEMEEKAKQIKMKKGTYRPASEKGDLPEESGLVYKHLVITKTEGGAWKLSHIPSGRSIGLYDTQKEARIAAMRLAEMIPASERPLEKMSKEAMREAMEVVKSPRSWISGENVRVRALEFIKKKPTSTPSEFVEHMADVLPPDQALALYRRIKGQMGMALIPEFPKRPKREKPREWAMRAASMSKEASQAKIARIAIDQARKAGEKVKPEDRPVYESQAAEEALRKGSTEPGIVSKLLETPGQMKVGKPEEVQWRAKKLQEVGILLGTTPTETLIGKAGKVGEEFVNEARLSVEIPSAKAGEFSNRLRKTVKGAIGKETLTDEQAYNILDALEGRAKVTPELAPIVDRIRADYTIVKNAKLSQDPDWKHILEDYFHRDIPPVDQLKKGKVREAVLKYAVHRGKKGNGYDTMEAANAAVDKYIAAKEAMQQYRINRRAFEEEQAELAIKNPELAKQTRAQEEADFTEWAASKAGAKVNEYLKLMVEEGRATDIADAARRFHFIETQPTIRAGAFKERKMNTPFYNPDVLEVMDNYYHSTMRNIYAVERFGKDFRSLIESANNIDKALGTDFKPAKEVYQFYLGMSPGQPGSKIAREIAAWHTITKMSMSSIANMPQGITGSAYRGNIKSLFGAESDLAKLDMTALEWSRMVGQNPELASFAMDPGVVAAARQALKAYGFTRTEMNNYIRATVTGRFFAKDLAGRLARNPSDAVARDGVKKLGLDPEKIIKQGGATQLDLQVASARFWRESQAIPDILNQPHRWLGMSSLSPSAKLLRQFQSTAYAQSLQTVRGLFGRKGQRLSSLVKLAVMYPLVGELIQDAKSFVTGRDRPEDELERYFDNMQAAFAFGLIGDMISWHRYGVPLGPTVSDIQDIGKVAADPSRLPEEVVERVPFVGRRFAGEIKRARQEREKEERREERRMERGGGLYERAPRTKRAERERLY